MSLACYVAHQTEGRTRLRVLEMPADPDVFAAMAERIAGVGWVRVSERRSIQLMAVIVPAQGRRRNSFGSSRECR